MDFLYIFFFFWLGASFASFLNLCVYRLEKGCSVESIFKGRSFCESCEKTLSAGELVPVLSFVFLRGKCSKCKKKIGLLNIFSEVLLGFSFSLFWFFGFPIVFYFFLIILYFFACYDFCFKGIPKKITNVIFLLSLLYWMLILVVDYDFHRILSVLVFLFLFLLLRIASCKKTLFGFGDVIVVAILALWFEIDFFLTILLCSFILGGFFSIVLVLKDRSYLKKYIPFLPFIFLGFLLASLLYYLEISLFDNILAM